MCIGWGIYTLSLKYEGRSQNRFTYLIISRLKNSGTPRKHSWSDADYHLFRKLQQNLDDYQSVGGKICDATAANAGHRLLSRTNRQLLSRFDQVSQLWRDDVKMLRKCSTIKSALYTVENKEPKLYAYILQIIRQASLICWTLLQS